MMLEFRMFCSSHRMEIEGKGEKEGERANLCVDNLACALLRYMYSDRKSVKCHRKSGTITTHFRGF